MNMNWIRVTAATAFLVSSLSTAAFAQGRPAQGPPGDGRGHHGRHHDPERRLQHLTERLHLDQHQVAIIRESFERMHQERLARRAEPARDRDERRARHAEFRERMHREIDAVLTPQQREEFARMRAEHEARRAAHRDGHGDCRGDRAREDRPREGV